MKYIKAIGIFLFYYLLVGSFFIPMLIGLINAMTGARVPGAWSAIVFFFVGVYFAVKSVLKSKGSNVLKSSQ